MVLMKVVSLGEESVLSCLPVRPPGTYLKEFTACVVLCDVVPKEPCPQKGCHCVSSLKMLWKLCPHFWLSDIRITRHGHAINLRVHIRKYACRYDNISQVCALAT